MAIKDFKELIVWQRAIELAGEIYKVTAKLPDSEKFGLVSQMRRCAVSIPSNIAEGHRRSTRRDFASFLRIAYGSTSELETQLVICEKLGYKLGSNKAVDLLTEISKMLTVMIRKLSS